MPDSEWIGGASGATQDPNTAGNWNPSGVPGSGVDLHFTPRATMYPVDGHDFSAVSGGFGKVRVYKGFSKAMGSQGTAFKFACSAFEFEGEGESHIDLHNSAIDAIIANTTSAPATGRYAFNLRGATALARLIARKGSIGIAPTPGDSVTVTDIQTTYEGAKDSDVAMKIALGTALTNLIQDGGKVDLWVAATLVEVYNGTFWSLGNATKLTTLKNKGGICYPNNTNPGGDVAIGTLVTNAGITDFTKSSEARTCTSWDKNVLGNAEAQMIYDPDVLTITNNNDPTDPMNITMKAA